MLLRSLLLALQYQRSRASKPSKAIVNFIHFIALEIRRYWQLGFVKYRKLIRAELLCADAGLNYRKENKSPSPPWSLPSQFLDIPVSNLPKHPLIDPEHLIRQIGQGLTAADALAIVCNKGRCPVSGKVKVPLNKTPEAKVAVCLHLYYPDMWPEIYSSITLIPEPFDLYVTIPSFASTPELDRLISDCPNVRLFPAYNHGRDVLPFLKLLRDGCFDYYDAVCKLHTKRSPHLSDGDSWRKELIDSLLGDSEFIRNILKMFRDNPKLGIIGPSKFLKRPGDSDHTGNNYRWMKKLADQLNLTDEALSSPFISGTMFWFNPNSFQSLKNIKISNPEFPIEMGQTDGTPSHAIERLFWPAVKTAGFTISLT